MFRRVFLAAVLGATVLGATVLGASAATVNYTAHLTGRSEVPKTNTKGKGKLEATFDTRSKVFTYTLTFENLSGPAAAAHIHGPANRKQTAGVVTLLGEKNPTSPVNGSITMTDDQVKMLRSDKLYVNVHTAANPGGEIRGQIIRAKRQPAAAAAPAAPATAAEPAAPAPAAAPGAGETGK